MANLAVQAPAYTLFGSGVTLGGNIMTLEEFKDPNGVDLTMADFGTKGFGTVEPGSGSQEEQISFTGVQVNPDGTRSLTGIKSVGFTSPYTETTGFAKSHAGGARFVISNTSGFYNDFVSKGGNATITGVYTFSASPVVPTPTTGTQAANKAYADALAIAGAPDASDTTKGITKLNIAPASPTDPIAVGANDVAATSAANKIVRADGSGRVDPSWLDPGLAEAATFFGSTDITGAEAETLSSGGTITTLHFHKRAIFQANRTANAANGAVTYAHGLGVAPKWVLASAIGVTANIFSQSHGTWDGTTSQCIYGYTGSSSSYASSAVACVAYLDTGGLALGQITAVDATDITITWTKSSSPAAISIVLQFTCGV